MNTINRQRGHDRALRMFTQEHDPWVYVGGCFFYLGAMIILGVLIGIIILCINFIGKYI